LPLVMSIGNRKEAVWKSGLKQESAFLGL
jgi:hypothetical protein